MELSTRYGLPYGTMVPGETTDWARDWSPVLAPEEFVVDSTWIVDPGLLAGEQRRDRPISIQRVTASQLGLFYLVNAIETNTGRVLKRTMIVEVIPVK